MKNYKALSDYHASLFSGIWVPNGNARLLGSHPLIGFQVGRKINTIYYNIGMNLKFLNSRNDFIVNYNDQLYETQFFIGVYLGVDVMKEILNYRQYRINICGGAGWEGVEVFDKTFYTAYENVEQKVIHSLNLNMGLNWQLYFRNQNYIGLQMKFHYLNYSNPGGTDLSGNSITISFVFGGFMNYEKYMGLLDLGYY